MAAPWLEEPFHLPVSLLVITMGSGTCPNRVITYAFETGHCTAGGIT